jgi:4-carboxymuconolactone decarboxylase
VPNYTPVNAEGAARRERAQGKKADALQALLRSADPEMADWADDFIFGKVWGREGLTHDERMLLAISQLAGGEHLDLLKNYLHGALQAGIPVRKIHEAIVQNVVYCGFPKTVPAVHAWRDVLRAAVRAGVVSPEDEQALDQR